MKDLNGDTSKTSTDADKAAASGAGEAIKGIGSESNFFTNKGEIYCQDGEWNPKYWLNKNTPEPSPQCEADSGCPFNEALPWSEKGDATTNCPDVGREGGDTTKLYQGQHCHAVCKDPLEEVLPKETNDPATKGWTCSYGDMLGGSYCVNPASGYTVKMVDVLFAEYSIEVDSTVDVMDFAYAFSEMYMDWMSSWRWMYKVDFQRAAGGDQADRKTKNTGVRRLGLPEKLDTIKDEKDLEAALSELSEQSGMKITKSRNLQGMVTYNVTQTGICEKSNPGATPPYHDMEEHRGMLTAALEVIEDGKPANTAFKATMKMTQAAFDAKNPIAASYSRRLVGGESTGKMSIIQAPSIYTMAALFGPDGYPVFQKSLAMRDPPKPPVVDPTPPGFCKSDALPTVRSAIWNCTSLVGTGTVCTVACLPGKAALRSADTSDANLALPIAAKWVSATCQKDGLFTSPDTKFNMLYCASILQSADDSEESTGIVIAILVLAMAIMITTCIVCVCQRKKQIEGAGDVEAPPPPPPPAPEPEPVVEPPAPEPVPEPWQADDVQEEDMI